MAGDEFNIVEGPALQQLQTLGWEYMDGTLLSPEVSDERDSLKDVVLQKRFTESVQRLNPWISEENLRKVVRDVTMGQYANLVEANQSIWNTINQCVSVQQNLGKGNKGQTVHIIDFEDVENNDFLCVNQFKVSGPVQNIIPDIILFVNGLPLVVIECKSPFVTDPIQSGINQLMRYANRRNPSDDEGAEKLFHYNQMMISTSAYKSRVGMITSNVEHYLEWKDPHPLTIDELGDDPSSQQIMIAGLFTKTNLLDIIQNFIVFEPMDGRIVKKMARYQQFRAVHKTIERIKTGEGRKERSGVIWHTQGSGKSLTMVFLTIKMRRDPDLREYKLVFVTDRTQLDTQLTTTFMNAQEETVRHAESVAMLKDLLSTDASDIVTTTVQKFQESADEFEFPVLNESEKIIVLADEAHRTQYGTLGVAINTALPNAPKIAFTGTPLIRTEKTTNEFGTYIDTYTIEQAVKDGSTIQILYEGREPQVRVTGDSLDSLFDEYFADRPPEEQEIIKAKHATPKAILEAPQRIRRICLDILKHYRESIEPNGFKAMIVTSSRHAAILYKEMLDELGSPESAVVISGDHNDEQRFTQYTNPTDHKQHIENFKKPLGAGENQSNLSFLIVKDMLLTGFDAPIAQVMYLDRKLSDHNLLQAIARVNRTNENKFSGYIVDYYGLSDYLTEALEMFSSEDVEGALKDLKDEIPKLKNAHTRVLKHFPNMDLKDHESCILSLDNEERRQEFQIDFRKFSKQMDIVLPDPAAAPFIKDLTLLGKISHGARNLFRDEQLNIAGVGEKVRKLIEEHVYSTGVDPKIAPVDLLDEEYKEKLSSHKTDKAKAADIEHAIRNHIRINEADDPEYYRTLSQRLEDIIKEHEERWDQLSLFLLEFRDTIETRRLESAQELGLSETEYAFHGILIAELTKLQGEDNIDQVTVEKVKTVVRELVEMMDEATEIVDFFQKNDEQRRMKKEIKRAIVDQFPKKLVKPVTDGFMELARVKFQ